MFGLIEKATRVFYVMEKKQQYAMARACCQAEWRKAYGDTNPPMSFWDGSMGSAIVPTKVLESLENIRSGRASALPRADVNQEIEKGIERLHHWSTDYFFGELPGKKVFEFLTTGKTVVS